MKQIALSGPKSQGHFAIVDDEDYPRLSDWAWHLGHGGYAVRAGKMMHRVIMNAPKGMVVDHGNHNRLDNRKCNLRIVTLEENNKNKQAYGSSSRFKGVTKNESLNRVLWSVRIRSPKKNLYLGSYRTEIEAARIYNVAAEHFYGKHAYLNPVGNWWEMKWEDIAKAWDISE